MDPIREVLGTIDLDPASCGKANDIIRADVYFDESVDGLATEWNGNIFLNPPSIANDSRKGWGPKMFWAKLMEEFGVKRVTSAIYLGFSLEQLKTLQNANTEFHPTQFSTCFLKKRIQFLQEVEGALVPMKQPTHSNFITLVSRIPETVGLFDTIFNKLGAVVHGNCQTRMVR